MELFASTVEKPYRSVQESAPDYSSEIKEALKILAMLGVFALIIGLAANALAARMHEARRPLLQKCALSCIAISSFALLLVLRFGKFYIPTREEKDSHNPIRV